MYKRLSQQSHTFRSRIVQAIAQHSNMILCKFNAKYVIYKSSPICNNTDGTVRKFLICVNQHLKDERNPCFASLQPFFLFQLGF